MGRKAMLDRSAGVRLPLIIAAVLAIFGAIMPVHAQRIAAAPEWNLTTLMAQLRQVRSSTAHFVELRYVQLLNQAQRSSGRLVYVAPDRLEKDTTEPTPERLTIIGDHLTIERPGQQTRQFSLRDSSGIGGLIESIRATLAGDLNALNSYFITELDGTANSWVLSLVPKELRLRQMVTAIRIKGSGIAIREIETLEADGDRTDIVVSPDTK
jgi:outer membrane lipoprotein-sorting protein